VERLACKCVNHPPLMRRCRGRVTFDSPGPCTERHRVYFSQLPPALLEMLGLALVESRIRLRFLFQRFICVSIIFGGAGHP
jgi:hypothetical protein